MRGQVHRTDPARPSAGRVVLPAGPRPSLSEPGVAAEVERRCREARDAGYADGLEQGRADAAAALQQRVDATMAAVEQLTHDLDVARTNLRDEIAGDLHRIALAIAHAVFGTDVSDDIEPLHDRIRQALDSVDDDTVAVRCTPPQAEALEQLLAADPTFDVHVDVVADDTLRPGEARIVGQWVTADLTLDCLWERLESLLHDQLAADPDVHRS